MRGSRPCRSRLLVLRMRPNGLGGIRYGFAISRRVGNAVVRNRIRRRLRPLVREIELPEGYDIVITPQPDCASVRIAELRSEIARCVQGSAMRIGRTP